jgi:hypothetical protein
VRLIDGGQQLDVAAGVALRKTMPPVTNRLELALGPIAGDQARHLCPAQPRHLRHVPSQQAACLAALLRVLLLAQKLLDPRIHLRLGFALAPDPFAGLEKSLDLIEAQLLCFVHAACQSSACHLLQAHLVLETDAFFRLILYWKRLQLDSHCQVAIQVSPFL